MLRPGTADIIISGERVTLVLDFNALAEYESVAGESLQTLFFELVSEAATPELLDRVARASVSGEKLDPHEIVEEVPVSGSILSAMVAKLGNQKLRALFWACLLDARPSITLPAAGKLFYEVEGEEWQEKYGNILTACLSCLMGTFGSSTPKKEAAAGEKGSPAAKKTKRASTGKGSSA